MTIKTRDTRVQAETKRATNTSFQRDMGSIVVLYSYATPVAVHDANEDVLYVSNRVYDNDHEEQFSHTTKCHVGRFRTRLDLERTDDVTVDHDDLEISVLTFDLGRKTAAKRGDDHPDWIAPSIIETPEFNEVEDNVPNTEQLSVSEEIVEEAIQRAASRSNGVAKLTIGDVRIEIPVGSETRV